MGPQHCAWNIHDPQLYAMSGLNQRPFFFFLPRGAAAAVIVYDITSADSLVRAKAWVKELQRQGSPNLIMALAGMCFPF